MIYQGAVPLNYFAFYLISSVTYFQEDKTKQRNDGSRRWTDLNADASAHLFDGHAALSDDEREQVGQGIGRGAGALRHPAVDVRHGQCGQRNVGAVDGRHSEVAEPAGVLLAARDCLEQAWSQRRVADLVEHETAQQSAEADHDGVVQDEAGRGVGDLVEGSVVRGRVQRERDTQHIRRRASGSCPALLAYQQRPCGQLYRHRLRRKTAIILYTHCWSFFRPCPQSSVQSCTISTN